MSCMSCNLTLNFQKYSPYGGYFCSSNHVQCQTCDQKNHNRCCICRGATKFVEIMSDIVKENMRLKSDLKYTKGVVAYFQAELEVHQHEVASDPEEESSTFTFMDSSKSIDDLDILNIKSSAVTFPAFEALDRKRERERARSRAKSQPPPTSLYRDPKRIQAGEHCDVTTNHRLRHRISRRDCKTKKSSRMQFETARREEFKDLLKAYQSRNVRQGRSDGSDDELPKRSHPKELKKPLPPHTFVTGRLEIDSNSNSRDLELQYKKDSKDMRIESILKTFAEGDISAEIDGISNVNKCFKKLRFSSKAPASIPSTSNKQQETEENETKSDPALDKMEKYLTRVRRANCMPFLFVVKPSVDKDFSQYQTTTPLPQTTPIIATKEEIMEVLENNDIRMESVKEQKIYISRQPVYCPDASCRRITFISDLNKHLIHDHSIITKERISTDEVKTYFLDAQVASTRSPKCHVLYLLRGKDIDIGNSEYNDLMPILLMSCKCHILDIFSYNSPKLEALKAEYPNEELLLLWLTGLVADDVNISANLCVWSLDTEKAEFHTAKTCNVYSIRAPQNVRAIYDSHSTMILTQTFVQDLTNNGKDMIGVQVIIH